MIFTPVVAILAMAIWTGVVWRAFQIERDVRAGRREPAHSESSVLALVLVVWGTTIGFALDQFGVEAPGLIGFAVAGVVILGVMIRGSS